MDREDGIVPGRDIEARAHALAGLFAEVAPRGTTDLFDSGVFEGAEPERARREWLGAALHACVRGAVATDAAPEVTADVVDAFHDLVLASGQLGPEHELQSCRAGLAERYAEYDGLARSLGQGGAAAVPYAVAAACAAHIRATDAAALRDALAPLLETLAEGATQAVLEADDPHLEWPPRAGLARVTERLDEAGVPWALGGSALLAALGLVDRVNDWDVQVDADPEPLRFRFAALPHTLHGAGGCHADHKFAFGPERVEVIVRFAFATPEGTVRIPLHRSRVWDGLPIASPEGWACAYWIMGRHDEPTERARRATRAELLFAWLGEQGADADRIAELLAEPLPDELAARLRALPPTRG